MAGTSGSVPLLWVGPLVVPQRCHQLTVVIMHRNKGKLLCEAFSKGQSCTTQHLRTDETKM